LKAQVSRYELLTDKIIFSDVRKVQNDDNYFVFEEIIRDVLLMWSRDEWIYENIHQVPLSEERILDDMVTVQMHGAL
jgi:hypothetical protein